MSKGFGNRGEKKYKESGSSPIKINHNEVDNLLRRYKKIKKYMNSSLYEVKNIDGTESIVNNLLNDT
jgi:hypothetical protein